MPEPWMSKPDRALVLDQLLRQDAPNVLEWGAGGSTMWFPAELRDRQQSFRWRAVEHNGLWFRRSLGPMLMDVGAGLFQSATLPVTVQLYDTGPRVSVWKHPEHAHKFDRYVNQDGTFAVILVDGRMRRRCLLRAAQLLAPGGVVLLHDAQRTRYHCAFAAFASGEFIGDALWIGRV